MSQDTLLPFGFPMVERKKVTAAFDCQFIFSRMDGQGSYFPLPWGAGRISPIGCWLEGFDFSVHSRLR